VVTLLNPVSFFLTKNLSSWPFECFFETEEALDSIGFSVAHKGDVTATPHGDGYFREFQGAIGLFSGLRRQALIRHTAILRKNTTVL
jgi:hypothetical protein